MKIVQICRVGWPSHGGMESVVHGLSKALLAKGHHVRVITASETKDRVLSQGVYDGVLYERLTPQGIWGYPSLKKLHSFLDDEDVIHVHGIDGILDQVVSSPIPFVVSTHGGYFHHPRAQALKAFFASWWTSAQLKKAKQVFFSSESDKRYFSDVKGLVLRQGIDYARWSTLERKPIREKWIVWGRIDTHKRIDRVIAMVATLRGVELTILGSGDPQTIRGLRALVKEKALMSRVRFVVSPNEVERIEHFSQASLAFFPSVSEGFGVALTEVMASGIPVVVSDISVFRERIVDGVNGFIDSFQSLEVLGKRLQGLSDEVLQQVGIQAQKEASLLDWKKCVSAYEQAYAD